MKKARRHTFVDPYGAELHLATTERQWSMLVHRFELDEDANNGVGTTTLVLDRDNYRPHLVVWVDVATIGDDALGMVTTCAHEAAHAAGMLLDHVRAKYDGQSEPFAYLVGWITRWLIEAVEWKH